MPLWHALCFPLLTGCFYLVPFEYAPANMPPEVVSMSPDNTIPVILDSDTTLLLFVEDPEADPVVFTWTMSGRGWLGEATPVPTGAEDQGYYGSQIPIVEDPDYDQRTVSCDIWDGVSEHVSVQWELEVAE